MNTMWKWVGLAAAAALLAGCASAPKDEPPQGISERLHGMSPEDQLTYLRSLGAPEGEATHDRAAIYFQMGNAHYSMGRLDSAAVYYERAVDVDPEYAKAWVNLGITRDSMNLADKARLAYLEALQRNPEDVLAMCHLGFNHFQRGEVAQAVDLYRKALAVDPDCAQAHYNLGMAFAEAKLFSEALVEWRRVIALDPDGELGRVARENVGLIETYKDLEQP